MTPIRTCVGCGARAPQRDLVRFVARDAVLRIDPNGRLPGRGAYLHRSPSCGAQFAGRRGPVRSLRASADRAAREALAAALTGATPRPQGA